MSCFNEHDGLSKDLLKSNRRLDRRHYKKDSRFVLDLYTLTYDSHESLDSLGDLSNVSYPVNLFSFTDVLRLKRYVENLFFKLML